MSSVAAGIGWHVIGASMAAYGNLFVQAAETSPLPDLKKKLLEMCQNRGKPYGIIVRKMDFPSSASFQEIRQMMTRGGQSGGIGGTASITFDEPQRGLASGQVIAFYRGEQLLGGGIYV